MMYVAHIASSLGLALFAAGFVALYFANRENSGHLKIAGWLLIVGAALGLLCNGYYSLKYLQQGVFDTPMMMRHANMMSMQGGMMRGGMMQGGMMQGGKMPGSMMPGSAEPPSSPSPPQ